MKKRKRAVSPIAVIVLILGCCFVLLPVSWMVITSFKTLTETFAIPPSLLPDGLYLGAYVKTVTDYHFDVFFKNSLVVVCMATLSTLVVATLAGFGVSRFSFRGIGLFLGFILVTQMFPSAIMLVPYFRILKAYGLINKYLGLILVYISFQTPLCTWLMYGYFRTIPKELDDAASIDGLGKFRTFLLIIFPLCLPGLAATAIYAFINSWNEFQFALVLTTTERMKTVSIGIGQMIEDTKVNWNEMMAASILASIPLMVVFLFFQKYFFAGLTAGSVKQ
jgi:ABC-type glycerol-3-phosphate transport system permease component